PSLERRPGRSPVLDLLEPAIALTYKVFLDHAPLGVFTGCDGLGVEVMLEQREEGGNQDFIHQLPVRLKYTNVKLTRPIDQQSRLISNYIAKMSGDLKRGTGEIIALGWDLLPVAT